MLGADFGYSKNVSKNPLFLFYKLLRISNR